MGRTLIEKILVRNSGDEKAKTGDIVIAKPDMYMFHDIYTTATIQKFYEMGFTKVHDPSRVALILDHNCPTISEADGITESDAFRFAKEQGIEKIHLGIGIGHTMMHELGYADPGWVVIVTDSHTTTYGGGACLGSGVGYSDFAGLMGTGELWMKIPPTIKVVMEGEWPKGVYAKDFILQLLSDIKADGAQYKSLEFTGEAARALDMDCRYTIANMALECGAKAGLFEADEKTAAYFNKPLEEIEWLHGDADAEYEQVLHYDVSKLVPMLAAPGAVDNGRPLTEWEGTKLTQVVIGSCTNSALEDIATAAKILKGKHVPPYLRFYVSTASNIVNKQCIERGYFKDLMEAGAVIGAPSCQSCCGFIARLGDDDVCLGTNNRNFLGRHGTKNSKMFLGSAESAAASALCGCITDPRKFL